MALAAVWPRPWALPAMVYPPAYTLLGDPGTRLWLSESALPLPTQQLILVDPKDGNEVCVGEACKTEPKPNDGLNLPGGAKNWITLAGLMRLQA